MNSFIILKVLSLVVESLKHGFMIGALFESLFKARHMEAACGSWVLLETFPATHGSP